MSRSRRSSPGEVEILTRLKEVEIWWCSSEVEDRFIVACAAAAVKNDSMGG